MRIAAERERRKRLRLVAAERRGKRESHQRWVGGAAGSLAGNWKRAMISS
jgi:hypothetical protein